MDYAKEYDRAVARSNKLQLEIALLQAKLRDLVNGFSIIEGALKVAVRAAHVDAPFGLDYSQSKIHHAAGAAAYQHALEMCNSTAITDFVKRGFKEAESSTPAENLTQLSVDKWVGIGQAGDYQFWVAREEAGLMEIPGNIFQCTKSPSPPSLDSGGYRRIDALLGLKGISSNDLKKNAFYPPDGWVLVNAFTESTLRGAKDLYETRMGEVENGFAPYDMTIATKDNSFIPIHGSAKMHACESALEAARVLTEYWERLPTESKMIARSSDRPRAGG